jgi:hypothetical protein|tara:strand:- start:159 stop:1010 length:852 start_codon:yes stop_codon:yes gene_type:complete
MKKDISTLVGDINNIFSDIGNGKPVKLPEQKVDKLLDGLRDVLNDWATPKARGTGLRMSNVGKPNRQLWYDIKSLDTAEDLAPSVIFRFLYGHIIEELMLFFVDLAGHKLESQQEEVKVLGLKGHVDCIIDGVVVDIKSASDYSFRKFKDGKLSEDDPFGYLAQLAAYEHGFGKSGGGFLVANKSSGEICLYRPDELEIPNIESRLETVRKELKEEVPPRERCYPIIAKGKSGNMGLHNSCKWCRHKFQCNPDLRVFKYSNTLEYLTEVAVLPGVEEITAEFI